ncbi:MAG TPA: hypothetical protein VNR20_02165 [Terriglobales bacterium]|nr:hypothetical protein [Terriglobales bacterium]
MLRHLASPCDATLARIPAAKFIPIDRDMTTESPSRDSRKTAACARFDERLRG